MKQFAIEYVETVLRTVRQDVLPYPPKPDVETENVAARAIKNRPYDFQRSRSCHVQTGYILVRSVPAVKVKTWIQKFLTKGTLQS